MVGSSAPWTHVAVASTEIGANWGAMESVLMVLWSSSLGLLQPIAHHNKGLVKGIYLCI